MNKNTFETVPENLPWTGQSEGVIGTTGDGDNVPSDERRLQRLEGVGSARLAETVIAPGENLIAGGQRDDVLCAGHQWHHLLGPEFHNLRRLSHLLALVAQSEAAMSVEAESPDSAVLEDEQHLGAAAVAKDGEGGDPGEKLWLHSVQHVPVGDARHLLADHPDLSLPGLNL